MGAQHVKSVTVWLTAALLFSTWPGPCLGASVVDLIAGRTMSKENRTTTIPVEDILREQPAVQAALLKHLRTQHNRMRMNFPFGHAIFGLRPEGKGALF